MAQSAYSRIRVGLVIAIGIAILCFAIFTIGHSRLLTRAETLEAHFHRINGLQTGAPVMRAGVRIGAVDKIGFPQDPTAAYVVVTMWIAESAADRIHADSIASINSMGLLGDKLIEVSAGHPESPVAEPGSVLLSRDPIDYESLLQKEGTDDLIANVIAISGTMRSVLDSINKGQGLLGQLIRGEDAQGPNRLTTQSIEKTLENVNVLSEQLNAMLARFNKGQGVMGALLSDQTNGKQFVTTLETTASSLQQTSRRLDRFIARIEQGQGVVPQLVENKQYADDLLGNMRESSKDIKDILHKINTGQGTVGLMVNDPKLYRKIDFLLTDNGGWALRMLRGLYGLTHPFSTPELEEPIPQSATLTSDAGVPSAVPEAPPQAPMTVAPPAPDTSGDSQPSAPQGTPGPANSAPPPN